MIVARLKCYRYLKNVNKHYCEKLVYQMFFYSLSLLKIGEKISVGQSGNLCAIFILYVSFDVVRG